MTQQEGPVISTDDEEAKAIEEEWRDPEDVRSALLIQGILPNNYPEDAFPDHDQRM
jgi:hypothetical protein